MIDSENPIYERPGFLTTKDRDFLDDVPEDIGNYAEKRRRIRQRTRSAFRDFLLLYENLPDKDREMIFDGVDSDPIKRRIEEDNLFEELRSMIAFVCLGLAENSTIIHPPSGSDRNGHHVYLFEDVLQEGIKQAYEGEMGIITTKVDLEIESYNTEKVKKLREDLENKAQMNSEKQHTLVGGETVRNLILAGEIEVTASDLTKLKDVTERGSDE